ncbi:DinB family protein [Cytobacillus sp. S13-E01]|uniref:DinB family protein n=1 Tax=Cytobacillus sp. S13-E01 TaxID=3031326 RepID=UPI0023D7E94A|nr:DinB family protein [Cytobacillus sp. S13-E01]MDF0726693.1 DinB family protein [Cytobacillus sp. S13-E01]
MNDKNLMVESLKGLSEVEWKRPITEGKWSISEIVSHFMNWDNYLISNIVPSVKKEEPLGFPEFDSFNNLASIYAKSGISQSNLIDEVILTRYHLVKELVDMPEEVITKSLPVNGVTYCPHTGEPYSLRYIIKEFIEHDQHHIQQIKSALSK